LKEIDEETSVKRGTAQEKSDSKKAREVRNFDYDEEEEEEEEDDPKYASRVTNDLNCYVASTILPNHLTF